MIARSMIAGAVLLAVATGCAPRVVATRSGALPDASGPVKATQKQYTDLAGNTLTLQFDAETGKIVAATATDPKRGKLDVHQLKTSELTVCIPKTPQPLCQPLAFITDGAFVKMGTATCTCYVYYGQAYCYGDTCG